MADNLPVLRRSQALARPHWWSADTTPEGFAVPRTVWVAPAFLLLFVGLSAALVPLLDQLQEWYVEPLAVVSGTEPAELLAQGGTLSCSACSSPC